MKGAKLIHDGRSDYWKNQLHQWPLWVGSAVGAGLGTALGVSFGGGAVGALGGVIGAVAGFEGTLAASRFLK